MLEFLVSEKFEHTALLDFTFFDQFSKLEQRKEISKTTKLVGKLLPNKIEIFPPTAAQEVTLFSKRREREKKTRQNIISQSHFS